MQTTRRTFTVRSIETAKVGRTQVTGTTGLYLIVNPNGARRFVWRYVNPVTKRPNEVAVGRYPAISLKDAREVVARHQAQVARNVDPVAQRRELDREATTFGKAVDNYEIDFMTRAGTGNVVFLVRRHAKALLKLPIAKVTTADVGKALAPTQRSHPKTARRALGAVATIFDFAKANDLREGDNPASWDVFKFKWPPAPAKVPMRAMPFAEVPAFYARLIDKGSVTAMATAFLVLCASRTAEVLGAACGEIDLDARLWVIPAQRMKARREHRVCLSDAALNILMDVRERHPNADRLFPAPHGGRLSDRALEGLLHRQMGELGVSVHGFRSSFSTWGHDETTFDHETIEACIAHQTGNAVSRSYNRGDQLQKRGLVMTAWADHVTGKAVASKVVALRR
jgi:integrase